MSKDYNICSWAELGHLRKCVLDEMKDLIAEQKRLTDAGEIPHARIITERAEQLARKKQKIEEALERFSPAKPHPGVALLRKLLNSSPTTANYQEYIKSPQWKRKADRFKSEAGHRCRICFGDGPLDAHHRTYQNLGNETDYDITVLCRECHKLYHDKMTGDNRPYAVGELEK